MPEISFTETTVPEETRESVRDKWRPVIENLAANRDKAMSFDFAAKTADDEKQLANVINQLQACGKDANVTVRKRIDNDGKGKVKVTVWVVDRITRARAS